MSHALWMMALWAISNPALPEGEGPRSREEARVLLSEGQKAAQENRAQDVVNHLSRLYSRYPADPGRLTAARLLADAYFTLKKPASAIPMLKTITLAHGHNETGLRARLDLSRAWLDAGKPDESYLAAREVESKTVASLEKNLTALWIESWLWQARSLVALDRTVDAEAALDRARTKNPSLKTPLADVASMEIQFQKCSRLPEPRTSGTKRSTPPLDEGQLTFRIAERGDCLALAFPAFRSAIQQDQLYWGDLAYSRFEDAALEYKKACLSYYPPTGKRTPEQLKRYQSELADHLIGTCKPKTAQLIEILEAGKEQLPKPALPYITRLTRFLSELKWVPRVNHGDRALPDKKTTRL